MRNALWIAAVLVLGLPAWSVGPSAAPQAARCSTSKPGGDRKDDAARQKAEAAKKKAAAGLAKSKASPKPGAGAKSSADSAFGSAARRALLANREKLKGKATAKTPPRAKM